MAESLTATESKQPGKKRNRIDRALDFMDVHSKIKWRLEENWETDWKKLEKGNPPFSGLHRRRTRRVR